MTPTAQGLPANGVAIRAFRLLLGMSQGHLAKEAGISAGYLSQLERGERVSASIEVLNGIAAPLRIDARAIMAVPTPATQSNSEQVTS